MESRSVLTNEFFRFFVFLSVGAICAVVDVGAVYSLQKAGLHDIISVSVGYFAGVGLNFSLHSGITFKGHSARAGAVVRFVVVLALNYALTIIIIRALVECQGVSVLTAKLVSLPVIAFSGFVLSRAWVFAK